jgi:hypothetical protein
MNRKERVGCAAEAAQSLVSLCNGLIAGNVFENYISENYFIEDYVVPRSNRFREFPGLGNEAWHFGCHRYLVLDGVRAVLRAMQQGDQTYAAAH